MLKNNTYYYKDCYMYFSFNGVHSSKYNLFMQNNKNDLKIENNLGAKSSFVSAAFQEGTYYTGTQRTQKTFKRKCAAEGLTLSQYKEMMTWLKFGATGFLVFDSNPYWGWDVVLTDITDASYMVRNSSMVVELELTFKTVGSYLARNNYTAYSVLDAEKSKSTCNNEPNSSMFSNEFGIPAIYVLNSEVNNGSNAKQTTYTIAIQSISNIHQYMNWFGIASPIPSANLTGSVKIEYNNLTVVETQIKLPKASPITEVLSYYGETHSMLINNNAAEMCDNLERHAQTDNILRIASLEPKKIDDFILSDQGLGLLPETALQLEQEGYNALCLVKKTPGSYNSNYNSGVDSDIYTTFLFFLNDGTDVLSTHDYAIDSKINNNNDYVEYLVNSQYLEGSDDTRSQYTTYDASSVSSQYAMAKTRVYYYNSKLPPSQEGYSCYMCKVDTITLTIKNIQNSAIEITAYNNL